MQVTESEQYLLYKVLDHLRSHEYSNVSIRRTGDITYLDCGHSEKLPVRYMGTCEKGTESGMQLGDVLTRAQVQRKIQTDK